MSSDPHFLASVDKSGFSDPTSINRVDKPWGWEIHFVSKDLPYMGKILHINGGKRLSLQVHDQKIETWYLLSGEVTMVREDSDGQLQNVIMNAGQSYTNKIGQKHRLIAQSDAEVLEVSTPEVGNTYRLEDDFNRPTESEDLRDQPNRGWIK